MGLQRAILAGWLLAFHAGSVSASHCDNPPRCTGHCPNATWWGEYAKWCTACSGTPWQDSRGGGCTPGANWGKHQQGATGSGDSLDEAFANALSASPTTQDALGVTGLYLGSKLLQEALRPPTPAEQAAAEQRRQAMEAQREAQRRRDHARLENLQASLTPVTSGATLQLSDLDGELVPDTFGTRKVKPVLEARDATVPTGSDTRASRQLKANAAVRPSGSLERQSERARLGFDTSAPGAGSLDFSKMAPGSRSGGVEPYAGITDERMVSALSDLQKMEAARARLDKERSELVARRNRENDPNRMREVQRELDKKEQDYQRVTHDVALQQEKVVKIHRTIMIEVKSAEGGDADKPASSKKKSR